MKKITQTILEDNQIFVGLEDSKRTWRICVRNDEKVVFEGSFPTDFTIVRNFFRNRFPKCKIKVIYEAGFQGFWLHDLLEAEGIECIVTPPNFVTDEKNNKVKNDKIDARRLAKNLANNDYKACRVPSNTRREDRQISRLLAQIQRKITSTKNQIRKFFDFHNIPVLAASTWYDCHYRQLRNLKLDVTLKFCLDTQLDVLDLLREKKLLLLQKLKSLFQSSKYRKDAILLKSVPGIGWLTAIRLVLEWGNIRDFKSGRAFACYNGLVISQHQTGDKDKRGGITKQGNRFARSWLVESAWTAIRRDGILLEKYNAVKRNSGKKTKAIVAVARKLTVRIRAVMLTGIPYAEGVIE